MDRLGLRVVVKRLDNAEERIQVYHNMTYFSKSPYAMINDHAEDLLEMSAEIQEATELLPHVTVTPPAEKLILEAILRLKIASNRTEFVALEAARAYAAADGRTMATDEDARAVAMMALRLRESAFMDDYFEKTMQSDCLIQETLDQL
jgi:magnesium chelatase subunit I